jgi:hypothetical protein
MLVKDLKVGAMYRVTPDLPSMVSIVNGEGLGDKFVYLGTKTFEYKEGSYNRRHKKNTWRLGLFGDKVLPIAPDIWTYIEPMEET